MQPLQSTYNKLASESKFSEPVPEQEFSQRTLPFQLSDPGIERKVESKESMWKPAPILGQELTGTASLPDFMQHVRQPVGEGKTINAKPKF